MGAAMLPQRVKTKMLHQRLPKTTHSLARSHSQAPLLGFTLRRAIVCSDLGLQPGLGGVGSWVLVASRSDNLKMLMLFSGSCFLTLGILSRFAPALGYHNLGVIKTGFHWYVKHDY